MLVLSRKKDEQIVIEVNGQLVRVQVMAVDGKKVRLGINAPEEIGIYRAEIWRRKAEFAADAPVICSAVCEEK